MTGKQTTPKGGNSGSTKGTGRPNPPSTTK